MIVGKVCLFFFLTEDKQLRTERLGIAVLGVWPHLNTTKISKVKARATLVISFVR